MDVGEKIVMGLFVLWAGAMIIGVLIALAPLILGIVGFILMMAILTFIVRLVASWLG